MEKGFKAFIVTLVWGVGTIGGFFSSLFTDGKVNVATAFIALCVLCVSGMAFPKVLKLWKDE